MPTEIVTTDDLREFKLDLIKEIKQLFVAHHYQSTKRWLKPYEVRSVSSMLSNIKLLEILNLFKIQFSICISRILP